MTGRLEVGGASQEEEVVKNTLRVETDDRQRVRTLRHESLGVSFLSLCVDDRPYEMTTASL